MRKQALPKDNRITLSRYNHQWPEKFEIEKSFLQSLIGHYVEGSIEHVGSTAIEGMVAKPIIDIMVGVSSLAKSKEAINILAKNGYCYYPYKSDVMHWFCKPTPEIRTHHLHLVTLNSPLWVERIAFRDHLQSNAIKATEYAKLKISLATEYAEDREGYTQAKWPFIKTTLASLGIQR
jgi:GrpB-like predicted nucleotidyltransferase (UPF0157 family)